MALHIRLDDLQNMMLTLREKVGMSQAQVAERCGHGQSWCTKLEADPQTARWEEIRDYFAALGYRADLRLIHWEPT